MVNNKSWNFLAKFIIVTNKWSSNFGRFRKEQYFLDKDKWRVAGYSQKH